MSLLESLLTDAPGGGGSFEVSQSVSLSVHQCIVVRCYDAENLCARSGHYRVGLPRLGRAPSLGMTVLAEARTMEIRTRYQVKIPTQAKRGLGWDTRKPFLVWTALERVLVTFPVVPSEQADC